jgi:hypothetical protein
MQIGFWTNAFWKTVPRAASAWRFGALTNALPYSGKVSKRCWSVVISRMFGRES